VAGVLVVQDNADQAALARNILSREGYVCHLADGVEVAWKTIAAEIPEAIILDVTEPGDDRWALLEHVRTDARFYNIPVVVLSLSGEDATRAASLSSEYLEKPIVASVLVERIHRAIARARDLSAPEKPTTLSQKRLALYLGDGRVARGTVYLPGELSRLSDAWEALLRDPRRFIPMTDAYVGLPTESEPHPTPLLLVSKDDIKAVHPLD
jgi:DNA-binding response OmpR family regulator